MDTKKVLLVLFVNLCISLGFYFDNWKANVLDISTDSANIIPICKKLDNPALYQNDLYLSDINSVKYYTPFYIQTLRAFALLTDGDYVQALNLLGFFVHLIYGVAWFFLFYCFKKDFILALGFSVFFRGVLWPPGSELLGISGLWTIMPRTLFIALAPLPVLAYWYLSKYRMTVSGLILGLILNFHPISGIGLLLCCTVAFIGYNGFAEKRLSLQTWRHLAIGLFFAGIGMMPYLLTYLTNVTEGLQYSQELYYRAFLYRIGESFIDPLLFIKSWIRPITFFLAIPFLFYFFFDRSENKRNFKIILITILVLFIVANSFVYVENAVNHLLHKNIRMAFQLIRIQKNILVLLQIGLYLLIADIFLRYGIKEIYKKAAVLAFFAVVSISCFPLFSKVPLLGDDLITSIYPESLKVSNIGVPKHQSPDIVKMIDYIKENTPKDAVFYGSFFLRSGADRSVVMDGKGAGMLIEGDANKFVQWYLDAKKLELLSSEEQVTFLKNKKVTYIMLDQNSTKIKANPAMIIVKKIGTMNLYKI